MNEGMLDLDAQSSSQVQRLDAPTHFIGCEQQSTFCTAIMHAFTMNNTIFSPLLLVTFFLIFSISLSSISAGVCAPFQTYQTSRDNRQYTFKSNAGVCSNYKNNSCCDNGNSKRALNWALQDDGCGVVGGDCLKYLVSVACMTNCAPDLPLATLNTIYGDSVRPIVCDSWAQLAYQKCYIWSWCGSSQLDSSTCTFRATKKVNGQDATVTLNAWDTCTPVQHIDYLLFANQILGVNVLPDNSSSCIFPSDQLLPAAATNLIINTYSFVLLAFLAVFSVLIL
jgi:hypothetical protein